MEKMYSLTYKTDTQPFRLHYNYSNFFDKI